MKPRILLIEDNEQNLYLLTYLLQYAGYEVVQAHDGQTGINLARQASPALIILDIQLPLMDGYAVARELRRDPTLSFIPIVAVTSYAMAGDRERILAAGCTAYLEKPIDPDTFVASIKPHLAPSQSDERMKG